MSQYSEFADSKSGARLEPMSHKKRAKPNVARDEAFMRRALAEAKKGIGRTSPNPTVGALIVRGGRVVARGYHRAAGLPHAEIEAIRAVKHLARCRGATLYVTLEPCSTRGWTPPCTDDSSRRWCKQTEMDTSI